MTFLMVAVVTIITSLFANVRSGVAPQSSGTEYVSAHSGGGLIQFTVSPNADPADGLWE